MEIHGKGEACHVTGKRTGEQAKKHSLARKIQHLQNRIATNRKRFVLYTVLRILVLITMVRCFVLGEYENAALCILSLVLLLLPYLAEDSLRIEIPVFFESIIYLFLYASWILGEIQNCCLLIPG